MQRLRQVISVWVHKQWSENGNKIHDNKDVCQRKWDKRYCASVGNKSKHSYWCFKKTENLLVNVNPKYANLTNPIKVRLEMDEQWGRVYCKDTPCWLWHAIDHDTGDVIAFVIGSRKKEMCKKLWEALLALNVEITDVYTDDNWSYHEVIPARILKTGKRNTQKIERKHLTFRTRLKRLARKTICYSKTTEMHIIMLSLLINVLEFGRQLYWHMT